MYPYEILFKEATANPSGRVFELITKKLFYGVNQRSGMEHDLVHPKYGRLEVKAFRAVSSRNCTKLLFSQDVGILEALKRMQNSRFAERGLLAINGEHGWGKTISGKRIRVQGAVFQQIEARKFDYLIGYGVFLDLIRIYLVPAERFAAKVGTNTRTKIALAPQHGNPREGVVTAVQLADYCITETRLPLESLDRRRYSLSKFIERLPEAR